ncbi:MAG: exo-alpha-sialidase, partial [Planctomycetales bacterium]|nr:exo-alpha-sialidase [Planctomycetales bacterium]
DVRLAPARPQKIESVQIVPLTLPALVGTEFSPLLKLKIEATGTLNPISLTELQGRLEGSENIETLHVSRGDRGVSSQLIDLFEPDSSASWKVAPQKLADGENFIWIGCKLKKNANIDSRVGAKVEQVRFSNGKTFKLDAPASIQRMGLALRKAGDDGVHTFRIPGLATTNRGTLIGVYDVRRRSGGDLPGDIDVGMSRSTDDGHTWEPMKIIMDMGDDPTWRYDGIGDPAVLVDRNTDTIWVAATWSHGDRSWHGSGPGLTPEETGQLLLVRSGDDGVTWSKPINITKQVKKPEWCFILQGPGKGITMRDGTLVFAAQHQDSLDRKRLPHATIIYSKDHGETWKVGTDAFDDTTEAQVVEAEPGVLMLNCRYNRSSTRVVMTTRDMGRTWQKHPTSERALIEPNACMASLIDADRELGKAGGSWLLFSNPDSTSGRRRITIKASPDRGITWPKEHRILLDEGTGAGYSCMTMIDEETVGILYEGSRAHLTFQRIPLRDITRKPATDESSRSTNQSLNMSRVFSDHMVLQADAPLPVWGQAKPGSTVAVQLGDETLESAANSHGDWIVRFPPRDVSAVATELTVRSGDDRLEFTDVLVGEVWLCAGQSNMEWMLSQSANGVEELSAADHPQLRLLHLIGGARGSSVSYTQKHVARLTPATYCEGEWKVASADSARSFSAVAWYFGRYLQQELKVPIGLICPAVGGTPTEAWIPREALEADSDLKGLVAGNWLDNERLSDFCRTRGAENLLAAIQAGEQIPGDELGLNHPFKPGFMWDAGIEPLIPYAIRGTIWYQGESNAETPSRVREHGRLFPLLIEQWRARWGQGDFPFLYVQLPAMNRPDWPSFRDGQRRVLAQLKNVGMAITIDTGHPSNVHPMLKKPVGERLAKLALGTTYRKSMTFSGPLFALAERDGGSLVVEFQHVGDGLMSSDGGPLRHFEACGKDGVFYAATARITGRDRVAVSSPRVPEPREVRYGWLPYPDPAVNLVNSAGLPASPFTTEK